jgi:hypothetical protein
MATTPIVVGIDTAIELAEQLIEYILQAKAAGALSDAQQEAFTTTLNNATRTLIVQADPALAPPAAPAPTT